MLSIRDSYNDDDDDGDERLCRQKGSGRGKGLFVMQKDNKSSSSSSFCSFSTDLFKYEEKTESEKILLYEPGELIFKEIPIDSEQSLFSRCIRRVSHL